MKDEDAYPVDTIVRLKKTNEFARIVKLCYLRQEEKRFFLNYLAEIEGREGNYAVYHDEVEFEAGPLPESGLPLT